MARSKESEGPAAPPPQAMAEMLVHLTKLVQELGARLTAENLELRARLHQIEYRLGSLERDERPKAAPAPTPRRQRGKEKREERADAAPAPEAVPRPRRKAAPIVPDPEAKERARLAQELKASRDGQQQLPVAADEQVSDAGGSATGR